MPYHKKRKTNRPPRGLVPAETMKDAVEEVLGGKAFTPANIKAGFAVSGIEPFNMDVFKDFEFLPSTVTDRPLPDDVAVDIALQPSVVNQDAVDIALQPSVVNQVAVDNALQPSTSGTSPMVSFESLHTFPKAGPRKKIGGRKCKEQGF